MIRVVYSVTTFGNNDASVTEIGGRVICLLLTASRIFTTGTSVEVVLAANVGQRIVCFLEALRINVLIEAKITVKQKNKEDYECSSFNKKFKVLKS